VDVLVGQRVRKYRRLVGMTQVTLADRLGFTSQQLHKYELADNRISASVLKDIADIFGVPVSRFFSGLEPGSDPADEHLTRTETRTLIRFYYAMPEDARSAFLAVVRAAAGGTFGQPAQPLEAASDPQPRPLQLLADDIRHS